MENGEQRIKLINNAVMEHRLAQLTYENDKLKGDIKALVGLEGEKACGIVKDKWLVRFKMEEGDE